MKKYRIVYEDDELLVIHKSAGLATQSARVAAPDLMSMLANEYAERGIREQYLGLANRLDQPVEGLLFIGKTKAAAAALSRQAADHMSMEKYYQALIYGKLGAKEGHLVDYLVYDRRANISRIEKEGESGGKRCELSYRVLEEWDDQSLLEIRLLTGRHHQIRVQLAHRGCPVVGDGKYGQRDAAGRQLCLCSCRTTLRHPRTGELMTFQAEPTFPVPPRAL